MSSTPETCEKAEPKLSPVGPSPSSLPYDHGQKAESPAPPLGVSPSTPPPGVPDVEPAPAGVFGGAARYARRVNSGAAVDGGTAGRYTLR